MNSKQKDVYISVDIESVGGVAGMYSMSSIGASVAGFRNVDGTYQSVDNVKEDCFYAELKPINDRYTLEAIKVGLLVNFDEDIEDTDGSLKFEYLKNNGENPEVAMLNFYNWVKSMEMKYNGRPVFMAYPASFDWSFVYYYFMVYVGKSPFGFSSVLDLKSAYSVLSKSSYSRSNKRYMPKELFPKDLLHTHNALDDAIEQGVLGMNILKKYE